MRKITADQIFPIASKPLENGVLIVDDSGKILAIDRCENHDPASLEMHRGALAPGFVNTHCHLELSHMKGAVDTGTGLIPFITGVVTKRGNFSAEEILDAIKKAEAEMLAGGIVALGDISNAPDTFETKKKGRLRYHTFLELFDFLQEKNAAATFAAGQKVFKNCAMRPARPRPSCHTRRTRFPKIFLKNKQKTTLRPARPSAYTTKKHRPKTSFF